jgi:excisionase family DNA binding protein
MPKQDYSTWLTKQQAADAIGVSTKTVEKFAFRRRLQQALWKRPEGGPAIVVYHPRDVEALARKRNPEAEAFVMPAAADEPPAAAPDASKTLAVRQLGAEGFMQAIIAAVENSSQKSKNTSEVRLAERLYLTIAEAAELTGLGVGYLRRQIAAGKLNLLKGSGPHGADLVKRADLVKL